MKLATIKDGSRDGQLAVVSRDLKRAHMADAICPTLQAALDDWSFIAPQLEALYAQLNAAEFSTSTRRAFDFDPARCMAPLPRAYQRAVAAAYVNHEAPASSREEPLMYQGASDDLLGPMDDIVLAHEEWGIDFEAGVAVIVDDVPMGATPDEAHGRIRLLMLANAVSLRKLIPAELDKGFGFLQSKPATGFSPLAVTPDELGEAWRGGKLHLPLRSTLNGHPVGQQDAGVDMAFNFPQLIAHLCKSRKVRAGSIVGSGAVSNKDAAAGYARIAEGEPGMHFGDTIRIDMLDAKGKSVFGAIEQTVRKA